MTDIDLSAHAGMRAHQRGIPISLLDALIAHADIEAPAGNGCTVMRISKQRLAAREVRAALGGDCDRPASLALIWSGDGEVVTMLHHHAGRVGRRYRRTH